MTFARSFTLLLCLCALALRMTGMHVHVAVDPDDAQHQSHISTFDLHQALHEHDTSSHDDAHEAAAGDHHKHIEVSVDSQALNKKPSSDLGSDALLFIATLFLLLLAPRKLILPLIRLIAPPLRRLIHLRPPLRGPPLHA